MRQWISDGLNDEKRQSRQVIELTPEKPDDWWEVEALYDLCFAPGREALSSYRLRDGLAPLNGLSLVARDGEGIVAGAIRFWPVLVGGHEALLLGPVAVHPVHQGEGLGGVLIRDGLVSAGMAGWLRVLLVGDSGYYGRFGFVRILGVKMPPPTNPERVLGQALENGAWDRVRGDVVRWSKPAH